MTHNRWLALVLTALGVATPAALLLALPAVVALPSARAYLQDAVGRRLERSVGVERISLSYWPRPALRLTRLSVASQAGLGPDPLLLVDEVEAHASLRPLLRGSLQLVTVTVTSPRVVLEPRRDLAWSLPAAGVRPWQRAALAVLSRIQVRNGRVEIRVPGEGARPAVTHVVDRIHLTLDALGWSDPIAIEVGARLPAVPLAFDLVGTVGPLARAGGDLGGIPAQLRAHLVVEEGGAPAGSGLGMTGRGEGELRVAGRLGQLSGDGRLALERVTVVHRPTACGSPTPRRLTLEGLEIPLRLAGPVLAVQPFSFKVADGWVRGDAALTWRAGAPAVRLSDVRVLGVAAEPLLHEFLCQPYAVAGRLDGSGELAFAGTGDAVWRSARGQWQVQMGSGRFVGAAAAALVSKTARAGAGLAVARVPASLLAGPLEFQSLSAGGTVVAGEVRAHEISLASRRVRIRGEGSYGLLDRRLDFELSVEAGRDAFGVRVGGTAQEPSYVPVPLTRFQARAGGTPAPGASR